MLRRNPRRPRRLFTVVCHRVRLALAELLKERFDIDHTTLQVDPGGPEADPAQVVPRQHCPDPHGPRHRGGHS
ncbi:hypothetical protein ACFQVD_12240 [Streptosporangium amethystogenes subsp. fukuiense]|uniref:Uncharacterized protein n=1 Tax=Streptosporangium amethystogenes subsp. fukuiense TaxID=698418 RepID=A0ABW2SYV9_9ACTN